MEERWSFLAPWCEVLRDQLHFILLSYEGEYWDAQRRLLRIWLPQRGDDQPYDEEFQFTDEDEVNFQKEFRKTHEALALLAAVAHVNYNAWRFLLESKCDVDFGEEGAVGYECEVFPRYRLVMDLKARDVGGHFDSDLVQLCGVEQYSDKSDEYLEALGKIAALSDKVTNGDIQIPVHVSLLERGSESAALLKDVLSAERLIRAQWEDYMTAGEGVRELAANSLRCTFVLDPMQADLLDCSTGPEMAEAVDQLLLNNVRFSQILYSMRWANRYGIDDRTAKEVVGQLTRSVFHSTRRPSTLADIPYCFSEKSPYRNMQPLQLGTVLLNCSDCSTNDFEAICSAMVVNQTTEKLSIMLGMGLNVSEVTKHRWKWVAYAFFSKRARRLSALNALALIGIGSVSVEETEGFVAVARSEHPEEELFGCPHGLVAERDATLRAGAPIRWQFDDGEPALTAEALTCESPIQLVRTFSDDGSSAWVNALVPGFGRCQVQRDDLVFLDVEYDVEVAGGSTLTSLQIGYNEADEHTWEGLPLLLAQVGVSLTSLGLDYHEGGLSSILHNCPKLEELTFCCGFSRIRLDFSQYEGDGDEFDYDWRDPRQLARALSNNTSPLSKCLRRWCTRVNCPWSGRARHGRRIYNQQVDTDTKALLKMLEGNQNLEYLDVHLPKLYHSRLRNFRSHHLTPIGRSLQALPSEAKLAFLSVLPSGDRALEVDKTSAGLVLCDLDQNVLANIFEFAARPALRQVYVHKVRNNYPYNYKNTGVI